MLLEILGVDDICKNKNVNNSELKIIMDNKNLKNYSFKSKLEI
jgi:hypothetical protein